MFFRHEHGECSRSSVRGYSWQYSQPCGPDVLHPSNLPAAPGNSEATIPRWGTERFGVITSWRSSSDREYRAVRGWGSKQENGQARNRIPSQWSASDLQSLLDGVAPIQAALTLNAIFLGELSGSH